MYAVLLEKTNNADRYNAIIEIKIKIRITIRKLMDLIFLPSSLSLSLYSHTRRVGKRCGEEGEGDRPDSWKMKLGMRDFPGHGQWDRTV